MTERAGGRRIHNRRLRILLKRKTGLLGVALLASIIVIAVTSSVIAPYDPDQMSGKQRLQPPSATHLFGTDNFGRDVLSRVIHGSRTSLLLGVAIGTLSTALGLVAGAAAGYFKTFGVVAMRVVDAMMAFPAIIIALFLMSILGSGSATNVVVALTVSYLPRITRTAYSLALTVKGMAYVEAALALGVSRARVLTHHLIPNMLAPILIQGTFTCAMAILAASSLDFLGVGLPPYLPSWGGMINEGKNYLTVAPWLTGFPGIFIAALVLSLNLLGDALRDALDPRFKARH